MPTTEDNPGTTRCEISSIGRGYEAGYNDGLQEGERRLYKKLKLQSEYARGWSEGIKQMNQEGEYSSSVIVSFA